DRAHVVARRAATPLPAQAVGRGHALVDGGRWLESEAAVSDAARRRLGRGLPVVAGHRSVGCAIRRRPGPRWNDFTGRRPILAERGRTAASAGTRSFGAGARRAGAGRRSRGVLDAR